MVCASNAGVWRCESRRVPVVGVLTRLGAHGICLDGMRSEWVCFACDVATVMKAQDMHKETKSTGVSKGMNDWSSNNMAAVLQLLALQDFLVAVRGARLSGAAGRDALDSNDATLSQWRDGAGVFLEVHGPFFVF